MDNTLSVLLIGRYGHPLDVGGVANAVRNIMHYAVPEGIDFHVVSIRSKKHITPELLKTGRYDSEHILFDAVAPEGGFSSRNNERFESAVSLTAESVLQALRFTPNLVHLFTVYPNYAATAQKIARQLDVPFIASARGTDVYGHNPEYAYDPDRGWYLQPLLSASVVTALSGYLCDELGANFAAAGIPQPELRIVHNGIDPQTFRPLEKEGIPAGTLRIVYTGRIREFKGVFDIIKTVYAARKKGIDAELDIYGAVEGPVKDLLERITEYLQANGLAQYIRCTGEYVPNSTLPERYRRHNMFITASRCEGMPNAIMEAMACGLAVALNPSSGAAEFNLPPEMIFETGNIPQMTGILCMLAEQPELLARYGTMNREFAITHHWETIARQYTDLYWEVCRKD